MASSTKEDENDLHKDSACLSGLLRLLLLDMGILWDSKRRGWSRARTSVATGHAWSAEKAKVSRSSLGWVVASILFSFVDLHGAEFARNHDWSVASPTLHRLLRSLQLSHRTSSSQTRWRRIGTTGSCPRPLTTDGPFPIFLRAIRRSSRMSRICLACLPPPFMDQARLTALAGTTLNLRHPHSSLRDVSSRPTTRQSA